MKNLILNSKKFGFLSIKKPSFTITLIALLLVFFMTNLSAQEEDQTPYDPVFLDYLNTQNCEVPKINASPVILFSEGAALFLSFASDPVSLLLISEKGVQIPIGKNERLEEEGYNYLIRKLPTNVTYNLYAENSCEEIVALTSVNTSTAKLPNGITVSDALYSMIRKFQIDGKAGSSSPFCEVLEDNSQVHFYEKVYFIQNYYDEQRSNLDEFLIKTKILPSCDILTSHQRMTKDCKCDFILNNTQTAAPAELDDGILENEVINVPKYDAGANGKVTSWNIRANKGASKYHQMWLDACKAGSLEREKTLSGEATAMDGHGISSQYGRLRYNLLCQSGQVLDDCLCREIPVRFYYNYNTEATAFARLSSCGSWTKKAVAAAQDIGMVMYVTDGEINIVNALEVRAQAECDKTVNPEFWQGIVEIITSLGGAFLDIYLGDIGILDWSEVDVDGLGSSIQDFIGTPAFTSEGCNFESTVMGTLGNGQEIVNLKPNTPVDFYVFSSSDFLTGGRKSFFSWGKVVSDFYLGSVVLPTPEYEDCCFEKRASWVFAGQVGSPWEHEQVGQELGATLAAWSPWPSAQDPFSGIINLPSDYGWMEYDAGICKRQIDPKFHISDEVLSGEETSKSHYDYIRLYSITGQLIYSDKNVAIESLLDKNSLIQLNLPYSGVYFLEKVLEGEREVEKVLLNK